MTHETYIFSKNRGGRLSIDQPIATIMAAGLGDDSMHCWFIGQKASDERMKKVAATKPKIANHPKKVPYSCPSIATINAAPKNGLVSCSSFSGAGGSCTGFKIAGFHVAWANEFIDFAADSYAANHPETYLERRDIRKVVPAQMLEQIGLKQGELDVWEGSPPCDSFSTSGKREKGWGKEKSYRGGLKKQRTDNLFEEWLRILKGLKPKAFVAENVSGMVKGTSKGYFKFVLREMRAAGYNAQCKVMDAQWMGVPQRRRRVIFVGMRNDLGIEPTFPKPVPWQYSVREACPWISKAFYTNGGFVTDKPIEDTVSDSITATQCRMDAIDQPDDVIYDTGGFVKNQPCADSPAPTITVGVNSVNASHFLVRGIGDKDTKTGRGQSGRVCPKTNQSLDLSKSIIKQLDTGKSFGACQTAEESEPCPTVQTVPHDTVLRNQRRKFTIPEVMRLSGFPDDYVLKGSYPQQWSCCGMCVPPIMMAHIAASIAIALGAEPSEPYWQLPGARIAQGRETA